MVTFEQIEAANAQLSTIQLGTGGKKKDYVMVPQRVKAFRMLYPEGYITTKILSHENDVVVMQATAGYYGENGAPVVLGTGFAFEERGKGMVNGTSYIENCETSAVGRALGFLALGIDGGGICSAEELVNAITAQNQNAQGQKVQGAQNPAPAQSAPQRPQNRPENGSVAVANGLPPEVRNAPKPAAQAAAPAPDPNPKAGETPGAFIKRRIAEMKAEYAAEGFDFMTVRAALIKGGLAEDVPSATMKMDQARQLMDQVLKFYEDERASNAAAKAKAG